MLSDLQQRRRALDAQRILDEPLLNEALDGMERAAIEEMLSVRGWLPWGDRKRRVLSDRINAIRDLRRDLQLMIATGKAAVEQPQTWA